MRSTGRYAEQCHDVAMNRSSVKQWVEGYERAWRTAGTEQLERLFSADVSYWPSPWDEPIVGLDQLAEFWEDERDGPDEQFNLTAELVAVEDTTAVVRLSVVYLDEPPSRWKDLWVLRFTGDGRCNHFEEWPAAPDRPDGH